MHMYMYIHVIVYVCIYVYVYMSVCVCVYIYEPWAKALVTLPQMTLELIGRFLSQDQQ